VRFFQRLEERFGAFLREADGMDGDWLTIRR
jgi:hypothetical protein